jgi:hypothetical protein
MTTEINPTTEQEVNDLKAKLLEAQSALVKEQQTNNSLVSRSLKVVEENQMYKASPELAMQLAEMEFQMKMAQRFIDSKAFKAVNPEQAYVMIKAGAEMGMKPVEAMQALYCVNGSVKIYGDKMVSRITKAGYKLEYLKETAQGVTVKVTNADGFEAVETVDANDPTLQKSNAFKFAPRNKMRFHAIRLIASFHLPHLFTSVADEFTSDFNDWEQEQPKGIDISQIDTTKEGKRIADHITKAKTAQELEQVREFVEEYNLSGAFDDKYKELNNGGNN